MCGVPGIVGDVESGRFMPRMVGWNWVGAGVTKGVVFCGVDCFNYRGCLSITYHLARMMKSRAMVSKERSSMFALLAFAAAPMVPAVTLPYLTPIVGNPGFQNYDPFEIIFFYLMSLVIAVLFGIPSFLVFRKLNLVRWWTGCIVGAMIGGGIAVTFGGVETTAFLFCSWAGAGAAGSLLFWIVWEARNVGGGRNLGSE
jgi:hypothetical protein